LGGADLLRRAMGKKKPEEMAKQRSVFVSGAVARGVRETQATHIFDLMEKFAGYGFNKSHSTAYAYLAYQTAYLKANYPWHFAAALLTIESQNADKLAIYLGECRERVLPERRPWLLPAQGNPHPGHARGHQGARHDQPPLPPLGARGDHQAGVEVGPEIGEKAGIEAAGQVDVAGVVRSAGQRDERLQQRQPAGWPATGGGEHRDPATRETTGSEHIVEHGHRGGPDAGFLRRSATAKCLGAIAGSKRRQSVGQ